MASRTEIEPGQTIPSVTKEITEKSILGFESTGILNLENIHNNPELAAKRLGTTYTLASGRMSITFATECLRKFFGPDVFNHTGTVNLKFLRPVKAGDTITVTGAVSGSAVQRTLQMAREYPLTSFAITRMATGLRLVSALQSSVSL
jgi:acyl dehydratase